MRTFTLLLAMCSMSMLCACEKQSADQPPSVQLGDSVCAQCNMIISDARWATATIVEGQRGPDPKLFDDFNCQVNYEVEHPEETIITRWSHDYISADWLRTEDATFLMSSELRTPMGSRVAAFAITSEAEAAHADLTGDLMDFQTLWARLGFAVACCDAEETDDHSQKKENSDAP